MPLSPPLKNLWTAHTTTDRSPHRHGRLTSKSRLPFLLPPHSMACPSSSSAPLRLMATFLSLFIVCLLLPQLAQSDSGVPEQLEHVPVDQSFNVELVKELDHAKSQLSVLEQSLLERDSRLHDKDRTISTLQAELELLQEKRGGEVEASLKNAHIKLEELLGKVADLEEALKQKEHELQTVKGHVKTLEAVEAEISSRNKKLEKASAEQKKLLEKAEQALRVAEAMMLRTQAEADTKQQELLKLHRHWLPPWAATHLGQLQVSAAKHWATHGEPFLNKFVDKVSERAVAAQQWANPQIEKFSKHVDQKVSPMLKQHWETVTVTVSPHVVTVKNKAVEGYEVSKAFLSPHLTKAHEVVQPYVQAAREFSMPYVEKVAVVIQPHFEQVKAITRPYTVKATKSYRRFLIFSTKYHRQLQSSVSASLKRHAFSAHLANKKLASFLASALLLLPVLAILLLFSSAFGTRKPKKPVKGTSSHGHKKARRPKQADK